MIKTYNVMCIDVTQLLCAHTYRCDTSGEYWHTVRLLVIEKVIPTSLLVTPGFDAIITLILHYNRWASGSTTLRETAANNRLIILRPDSVKSLASGKFQEILDKLLPGLVIGDWYIHCEIALRWMPQNLVDAKSKLVPLMVSCRR